MVESKYVAWGCLTVSIISVILALWLSATLAAGLVITGLGFLTLFLIILSDKRYDEVNK